MLRTLLALGLVFVAFLILYGALIGIFLISPGILTELLGGKGGVLGAIVSFGVAVFFARRVMRLSDRLLTGDDDAEALLEQMKPPSSEIDFVAVQGQVARNKRWAHLRRTRQFDKLAALESEESELSGEAAKGGRSGDSVEPSTGSR